MTTTKSNFKVVKYSSLGGYFTRSGRVIFFFKNNICIRFMYNSRDGKWDWLSVPSENSELISTEGIPLDDVPNELWPIADLSFDLK